MKIGETVMAKLYTSRERLYLKHLASSPWLSSLFWIFISISNESTFEISAYFGKRAWFI